MLFKFRYILLVCACFYLLDSSASAASRRKVVQISGVVMNHGDLVPIPYVNISVVGTYRGTSADGYGFFTLVLYAGDTIRMSSVGYKHATIWIPDTLSVDRYTLYQTLRQDTIELPVTVVYPWPSKERFREAFLKLDVPDDDYEIARKNLTLAELRSRAREGKMDANMNYRNYIQKETDKLYYAGQSMPNNLLNPFAWAQFLNIWKQQRKAKKVKTELDWDD